MQGRPAVKPLASVLSLAWLQLGERALGDITGEPHTGSVQASEERSHQRPQSKAAAAPRMEGEAHNVDNGKLGAEPVMVNYHDSQLSCPSATSDRNGRGTEG